MIVPPFISTASPECTPSSPVVNVYAPSFIVTAELLWTESSAEFIVNVPPFIYNLPSALIPFVLAESESKVSLSDCSVPSL